MGRKKIKIEYIQDRAVRAKAFKVRSATLLKKVKELAILCDTAICLFIGSEPKEAAPAPAPLFWPSAEKFADMMKIAGLEGAEIQTEGEVQWLEGEVDVEAPQVAEPQPQVAVPVQEPILVLEWDEASALELENMLEAFMGDDMVPEEAEAAKLEAPQVADPPQPQPQVAVPVQPIELEWDLENMLEAFNAPAIATEPVRTMNPEDGIQDWRDVAHQFEFN